MIISENNHYEDLNHFYEKKFMVHTCFEIITTIWNDLSLG